MNCKRKGTRNEHRSILLLEATGYRCTRAAASLGVWDLIGIGSTDVVLVQVKTRDWPGTVEMETLRDFPCHLYHGGSGRPGDYKRRNRDV
jgi:hypothetical protein